MASNNKKKKKEFSFEEWSNANHGISKEQEAEDEKKRQAYLSTVRNNSDIAPVRDDSSNLREATWKDVFVGSFSRGYQNSVYGTETFKKITGQDNEADVARSILEQDKYQFEADGIVKTAISGAMEQLGQEWYNLSDPETLALMAGGGATGAGAAALGGQLGPQVLLPEEVVTVPAGFLAGASAGYSASATANAFEIEAGLAYNEMIKMGISEDTAKAIALGVGGFNAALELAQLDELVGAFKIANKSGATDSILKVIGKELLERGVDVAKETAQEVAQEGVTIAGTQLANKLEKGEWAYDAGEVGSRLGETAISSALTFGAMNVPATVTNIATGTGSVNHTVSDEDKVVNKITEHEIARRESEGETLTSKEKKQIAEAVQRDMDKGNIPTEAIEAVLGGDSYKAYRDTVTREDALRQEYEELGSLEKPTLAQQTRYQELHSSRDTFINDDMRNDLRSKASDEVRNRVRGTRLEQSYLEIERKKERFTADPAAYKDENSRKTVENIVNSGLLDNSNKSHEMVDFMAKLSKDRKVTVELTNNKKLKEEGKVYTFKKDITADGNTSVFSVGVRNLDADFKPVVTVDGKAVTDYKVDYANGKITFASPVAANSVIHVEYQKVSAMNGSYTNGKRVITLNVDSKEAVQVTLGHELKHSFEGTEYESEFNDAIKEYAKKVGTYDSIVESVKKIYNGGTQKEIDSEVTAILTGEYIATDEEFVKYLSTNHRNIFQRIYDAIKHWLKMVTAGSEEARALERAKHLYAKRYRADVNVDANASTQSNQTQAKNSDLSDVISDLKAKHAQVYQQFMEANRANDTEAVRRLSEELDELNRQISKAETEQEYSVNGTDAKADDGKVQLSLSSIANTFYGDENMSAIAFEEADYKQTDGYKNYVSQCLNNMRQSRADFDETAATEEIEKQIDGIVRVALAAKKAGYDIHDDANKRDKTDSKNRLLFSSLEPNSEYFTSNDISTICDKRKNFAEIYDDIVRAEEAKGVPKGKRFFDNVDNYFYLHNVLAAKGLTQPCRQCYVESMRKNLAPMANAFLKLVNETDANNKANDQLYQPSGKNKGQLKTSNAELRAKVLETFETHPEYGMSVGDLTVETLTTEDGLAQLKIQAPLIYEAFNSFYGQSKPKMPKAATPFRFGELTALLTDHNGKIKQSLVDKINSTGGFRLQSYSDFQIQNYTDVLQVIFEAGTLGLNGHAYTKVPAFLEATEGTNLKRNISIFMYKDGNEWKIDRNDSFPYTLEEIYDIVNSDKSGNTSIIAVSQNKEMSAWIMANDYVGQGIPFHKSGMKMGTVRNTDVKTEDGRIVKGYSGTIDHTKQQTEVWAKANADHKALTKVKKGIDIYSFWDFDNKENLSKNELIEKNLKAYIDACEEAGYLPKFRDYVMNNGTVLNDVLKYSKELGFASQDATIDDISFEYKGYRIPYGYYKFLGDFGMFKPDGTASPHDTLSLNNYDFDKAEQFFSDAESLRRNEILQQFANGEERQKYRDSDLDAGQLDEIIHQKRKEVVDEIVAPVKPTPDVQYSISPETESERELWHEATMASLDVINCEREVRLAEKSTDVEYRERLKKRLLDAKEKYVAYAERLIDNHQNYSLIHLYSLAHSMNIARGGFDMPEDFSREQFVEDLQAKVDEYNKSLDDAYEENLNPSDKKLYSTLKLLANMFGESVDEDTMENTAPYVEFDDSDLPFSISAEGEKTPIKGGGTWRTPFRELAYEDIAPVSTNTPTAQANTPTVQEAPSLADIPVLPDDELEDGTYAAIKPNKEKPAAPKSERIADGSRSDELLYESLDNHPVQTLEQKIAEKIRALHGEIADRKDLRREKWDDYESRIADLRAKYNSKKNKNTKEASKILQSISRLERMKASDDADFSKRISDLEARIQKMSDPKYGTAMQKRAKMEADAKWAANLLGDTSTWVDKKIGLQYATNTERRNLRDIVRDENGNVDIAKADAIDDALNGQYNRDEAAKKKELAKVRGKYADLKITKAEDAYIQMLGEFRHNPDTSLTDKDISEYYEKHKSKIDTEKVDKVIEMARQDYDSWLNRVNAELKKQGMKEIPYRQGYFQHFTEPKQNFIQKLLNWKTQDNEIPTSIAGLTETFKPTRSWQAFDKRRYSDETDYSFMKGLDSYSEGALDWIYHMDTLQKRRAVENHIRYTHSDEGISDRIKAVYASEDIDANEAQAQIEQILSEAKNPLNNFVQDFTTHTNILAGKKNSLDRTLEQWTNRNIYSVMTNVQNRMSANMVLANVRSALTNFIPITQSWAQVSPLRSLQAAKDTIANSIKDDGTVDKSAFLTNRLREVDRLYQTNWDKVLDKAGIMFEIVDNFSSQVIWRSKYNQNLADGMSEAEAIRNADQFAENVMAGRSKGNEPTLFNAKNPFVKAFTMFQLEVNNQYGYLFKDVPNDLKAETEHWKFNLAKGYTAVFVGAYVYNALLEKVTGSDAALDPIGIVEELLRDLGLFGDDEEEEPEKVVTNLLGNVAEELPFIGGVLGGGRVPISSAIPYGGEYGGGLTGFVEDVGNIGDGGLKNIGKELMKPILNVGLPVAGNQIKKTYQGLNMFSDEHPVTGSYTTSGNLRFPVEDTPLNRAQAAIFGQYASKNAREYFDNDYAPLNEKQIREYIDVDMPISDYWKYREGLNGKTKAEETLDYISGLDLPMSKKNILANNALGRKDPVDLTNYEDFGSLEEFDFATKSPDKYAFAKSVGGYSAYKTYSKALDDLHADKDENGKSIKDIRKEKVINYINSLDADYYAKIILYKSEYPSDDTYNYEIVKYINDRSDLTYEERVSILTQIGFRVTADGQIYAE